jgi:fibronectin type 3 domain-containing protein
MRTTLKRFYLLTAVIFIFCLPFRADVPAPPVTPPPPAGYCSTIYNELQGYLDTFNQTLGTPAPYPTLQIAQLQAADSNAGPAISGPNYLATVMVQVQELQAMGFQGVKVEVAFPVLYEPFYGSPSAYQPYLDFYQQLAQNIRALGLKLVIENDVTPSTGTEAGWPNVGAYYNALSWAQYIAARATMAGTIAQYIQPDFLMLAQEPDNEALNTGQSNLNTPSLAAAMIAGEINAARAASLSIKLGAGFGTWMGPFSPSGLQDYLNAYVALPLDYIDMHIYAINTEYYGLSNLLNNALIIANGAAAVGKPVAISESWPWKMEDSEFDVVQSEVIRARDPFSFWPPIDSYFIQTMEKLANYTQMLYLTSQGTDYFFAYQTYGGTVENGGAANCTCTTATCSAGDIVKQEHNLAVNNAQTANFTSTGLAYNSLLVVPPDTVPPSDPANLVGTGGYASLSLSWSGSTDNVGVAGYNVYRCTPPPCTGSWIANSTATSYFDAGLADNTTYQYQVEAFDIVNNRSLSRSNILILTTYPTITIDLFLVATPVSPTQITLSWTAPPNSSGVSRYLIYRGTTPANLLQIATVPSTWNVYQDRFLIPATTYCYALIAVEYRLNSPMSSSACATTFALPNPPSQVVATPVSATRITLTWQEVLPPGGLPIANYQIYQGTAPGALTKISTVKSTAYNILSLTPSTMYCYEIVAADSSFNTSQPSNVVCVWTMPLPPAPTNLQASSPAATKINLTWEWSQAPGGLPSARFSVYCGTSTTGQPKVGTVRGDTFTYVGASPATQYYCFVVATDTGMDYSPPSASLAAVTPPMPNAPANLHATANTCTKVTVTWSETVPPGGLPVGSYKIYRSTTPSVTLADYAATRTTASYIDTTVTGATTYYYAVSAIDTGHDTSPLSAYGQVTTP